MPKAKTWIWIILAFIGGCLLILIALAGASVYWVRQHVQIQRTSAASSLKEFETARATFQNQIPLIEMDSLNRPHQTRPLSGLPTSSVKPTDLVVMVWDQDKEQLIHVSMPFWLLKLGRRKIDLANGDRGFDFEQLNIDVAELERVGPILVLDTRSASGARVLAWTR